MSASLPVSVCMIMFISVLNPTPFPCLFSLVIPCPSLWPCSSPCPRPRPCSCSCSYYMNSKTGMDMDTDTYMDMDTNMDMDKEMDIKKFGYRISVRSLKKCRTLPFSIRFLSLVTSFITDIGYIYLSYFALACAFCPNRCFPLVFSSFYIMYRYTCMSDVRHFSAKFWYNFYIYI